MSRASINFLVDCLLLVLLLALLWTSILLRALFPAPSEADGWTIWGMNYDTWSRIQFFLMLALTVAVGIHLILHWTWICGFVAGKLSRLRGRRIQLLESHRTIYGVTMLIGILSALLAMLFAASLSTVSPS